MLICKNQDSSNSSRKEKCQTDIAGLVSPLPRKEVTGIVWGVFCLM